MPDLYAADQLAWVTALLTGSGFAAFLAALVRELFRLFGGRGRA